MWFVAVLWVGLLKLTKGKSQLLSGALCLMCLPLGYLIIGGLVLAMSASRVHMVTVMIPDL